jgi:tetratricopeptide (TPR) repeat protein
VQARLAAVSALQRTGQIAAALALVRPTAAEARAIPYADLQGRALLALGGLLEASGDFGGAEAYYKEARHAAARAHDDLLMAEVSVGLVLDLVNLQMRAGEVPQLLSAAEDEVERAGAPAALLLRLAMARGMYLYRAQRFDDSRAVLAEALRRAAPALPAEDVELASARLQLGLVERFAGDYAVADATLRRALVDDAVFHPEPLTIASNLVMLGAIVRYEGRLDEAAGILEAGAALMKRAAGPGHYDVARALIWLACVRADQRRYDESVALLERALAQRATVSESPFPRRLDLVIFMAKSLAGRGQTAEALAHLDAVVAETEKAGDDVTLAEALFVRADVLAQLGRLDQARRDDERALAIDHQRSGAFNPFAADDLVAMARIDLARGHPAGAIPLLERAVVIGIVRPGQPWHVAEARFLLAHALAETGGAPAAPRMTAHGLWGWRASQASTARRSTAYGGPDAA